MIEAGLPLDFADPEMRLSDMKGYGVQDIVKIRRRSGSLSEQEQRC